jgi:hypothetical protein
MSAFQTLLTRNGKPLESAFAAINVATERAASENDAATKIQSVARMRSRRLAYLAVRQAIVDIQRIYRAFVARKRVLNSRLEQQKQFNNAVFHHYATVIQATYRGFYVRRHVSDFFARLKYLRKVVDASENVRKESQAKFEAAQKRLVEDVQRQRQNEYKAAATSVHHLLSTASVSGVYRPALSTTGVTTVFGTSVEDDIREVPPTFGTTKRKFKTDLPSKTNAGQTVSTEGATVSSNSHKQDTRLTSGVAHSASKPQDPQPKASTARKPVAGPSLQASVPFDIVAEHEQLFKSVDQKLVASVHGKQFSSRRPEPVKFQPTLAAESQYVESATRLPRR